MWSVDKDIEQLQMSCSADWSVCCYNHFLKFVKLFVSIYWSYTYADLMIQ